MSLQDDQNDDLTPLSDVLRQTDDMLFAVDTNGHLTALSPAFERTLGWNREELVGTSAVELVHPEENIDFHRLLDNVQSGQSGKFRRRLRTAQGDYRLFEIQAYPLVLEDSITGIVGMARDVSRPQHHHTTEILAAREEERLRLLGRLIHDLSHDIRTPLSVISTNAYLARRKISSHRGSEATAHLLNIENQVALLGERLANILTVAHLEGGAAEYEFVEQDVNMIAQAVVVDLLPQATDAQKTLRFESSSDSLIMAVDEGALRRALWHMVVNAINYTPAAGRIVVRTEDYGDEILIAVEDNGIGMSAAEIEHIFDLFYRADKARNHETGGSGLGLPIARHLIAAHGGRIQVTSESGVGSQFCIYLPKQQGTT